MRRTATSHEPEDLVREGSAASAPAQLFASAATGFDFERHVNWQEDDSVESFADLFIERYLFSVVRI